MRWDTGDVDAATACYAVHLAAHLIDEPVEPPMSAGTFRCLLSGEWEGAPGEVWYAAGDGGEVTGYYRLDLPDRENLDRAFASMFVHPDRRRHGIGRELLTHAAQRAAVNGRAVLEGVALEDSAGDAFARRAGARLELEEARRIQDLTKIPPGRVAELRETAARAAAGYSLVTWLDPIPEQYLAQVAELYNAFNDAPHSDGWEPEVWDADRIRQRTGRLMRAGHMRGYSVAAVHDATAEMSAYTQVMIDPEHPEWGNQELTAVTRRHRGHRLGLLVKTAMLMWLAEAEPKLERIGTGNAVANQHMIAVNEALGYEVVRPGWKFYEIPVTDVT